jgi:hypothetical protein
MMINVKKIIVAMLALALLAAIVPTSQADSAGVQSYKGLIGADSPLYGLKIFAQNLDLAFTFDNTNKLEKQMNYANERVSEMAAAEDENNTAALEAAGDQYASLMDALNETSQADDINESVYANLQPMLIHHNECFYALMNNTTNATMVIRGRLMCANNETIKIKNGMPFYYYNGTAYFIPPGQMKKMGNNSTFVPPGLAKKGYVKPVPTITNGSNAWPVENGSPAWPWDRIQYPYNNNTKTKVTFTPKDNNGNGRGNGNGNGNANEGGRK